MSTCTSICSVVASSFWLVTVKHLVIDQQPLSVDTENPCGDVKRRSLRRLAEVRDVGLDRVEAVTVGAVLIVVADVREHRVAGPTERGEVRRLGHVPVVVDPFRQHFTAVEIERSGNRVAGFPTRRRMQHPTGEVGLGAAPKS